MCDEYDDERMVAFWRALAEGKDRALSPSEETDDSREAVVIPAADFAPAKPRAKPLVR